MTIPSLDIAWQKMTSVAIERWLRIQTTGYVKPINGEAIHYTPLPYIMVFRLLRRLELSPTDVFVDIGSGKGRVVCCAARWPVRKVVGIELNEELVEVSQRNVRRLRGRQAEVHIVHTSAEAFNFDGASIIYLYNPFTERLTTKVLELIDESQQRSPRPLRLILSLIHI